MDRLRQLLHPYKQNYFLRAFAIAVISVCIWFLISGGIGEAFAIPIIVLYMEYITINILYDMDFVPVDVFARRTFGSKDSLGYQLTYWLVYAVWWIGVIITLVDNMKNRGLL